MHVSENTNPSTGYNNKEFSIINIFKEMELNIILALIFNFNTEQILLCLGVEGLNILNEYHLFT